MSGVSAFQLERDSVVNQIVSGVVSNSKGSARDSAPSGKPRLSAATTPFSFKPGPAECRDQPGGASGQDNRVGYTDRSQYDVNGNQVFAMLKRCSVAPAEQLVPVVLASKRVGTAPPPPSANVIEITIPSGSRADITGRLQSTAGSTRASCPSRIQLSRLSIGSHGEKAI